MTLILTAVSGLWVVQVGDRLLTQDAQPWDPLANKSILLLASNGSACISYSGLAYLFGQPTDEWLAEAIHGEPLPIDAHHVPTRIGPYKRLLGPAVNAVTDAIQRDFVRAPARDRRQGLSVAIGGWTWKRRTTHPPRPSMLRMKHTGADGARLMVGRLDRYWPWHQDVRFGHIGTSCNEELKFIKDRIGGHTALLTEDDMENILAEAVIRASERTPVVGADLMSLVIRRDQLCRVRYIRNPKDNATNSAAYSPWIIGPGIIVPPQVIRGGGFTQSVHAGRFIVAFDQQPPLPAVGHHSSSGQRRKQFP